MDDLRNAIADYRREVEREAVKQIEQGEAPWDAVEHAGRIVRERRSLRPLPDREAAHQFLQAIAANALEDKP